MNLNIAASANVVTGVGGGAIASNFSSIFAIGPNQGILIEFLAAKYQPTDASGQLQVTNAIFSLLINQSGAIAPQVANARSMQLPSFNLIISLNPKSGSISFYGILPQFFSFDDITHWFQMAQSGLGQSQQQIALNPFFELSVTNLDGAAAHTGSVTFSIMARQVNEVEESA